MTKMVLSEVDIDYYAISMMVQDARKIADDHMKLFGPETKIGQWLRDNEVRATHTMMNNPNQSKCKSVVYADLTEHQQTDYILRFS